MRGTEDGNRPTIGVLTPFVGGWYFGGVLSGVADACRAAGADLITVQTYDAGATHAEIADDPDFRLPVARDRVDGWIVVINAVGPPYIQGLKDAGIPVALVSLELPGMDCPAVMPDNIAGVREAMTHLIEHGHRRIAFVGNLDQRDIQERYQAYCDTLTDYDIPVDADLFFHADDNLLGGGLGAGRRLLDAGLPSTAIMAGTDLNAMGVIDTLVAAGLRIPDDQAVVGFDDIEIAADFVPPLTTVRQPFPAIGAAATSLLLATLAGDEVLPGSRYLPGSFVARRSCGCPPQLAAHHVVPASAKHPQGSPHTSEFRAAFKTQYEVSMELLASRDGEAASLSWLSWTQAEAACLGLWDATAAGDRTPLRCAGTYSRDDRLDGVRDGVGGQMALEEFPPTTLLAAAQDRPGEVLFVVPVKTGKADLGLLAVIAPVETVVVMGRELVNQWAALLAVASEHEAALASLEEQGRQLHDSYERERKLIGDVQLSEQRYALAARAANDGLWDWDVVEHTMYTSDRWWAILGHEHRDLQNGEDEWFSRVHPADLPALQAAITPVLRAESETFEHEYRMRDAAGGYRWLNCRAVAVAGGSGAIVRLVGSTTDVTDRRELADRLRHDAFHDPLTGLPNRNLLLDRLDRAAIRSRREPEATYAILFIDLDQFKAINDTLGHSAGDQVLIEVSRRLRSSLRAGDTVARFGGDEFAVLLTDVNGSAAVAAVADELRRRIVAPLDVADSRISVRASIGVALSDERHRSPAEMLRAADSAMYRAKSPAGAHPSASHDHLPPADRAAASASSGTASSA